MTAIPTNISIANARLPQTYEAAKSALANCASIDECQEWANKAEALASYAKMADDDSLRRLADRIQARAVRRCGELLKTYDGRGEHWGSKKDGADLSISSRAIAARGAGLSERQQKTAVRVANVPEPQFEEAVEAEKPATVTKLADMGRKPRPAPPPPPQGFREATAALGTVSRFAAFCRQNDPQMVAGGVMPVEVKETRDQVATIDAWLDRFVIALKE